MTRFSQLCTALFVTSTLLSAAAVAREPNEPPRREDRREDRRDDRREDRRENRDAEHHADRREDRREDRTEHDRSGPSHAAHDRQNHEGRSGHGQRGNE